MVYLWFFLLFTSEVRSRLICHLYVVAVLTEVTPEY